MKKWFTRHIGTRDEFVSFVLLCRHAVVMYVEECWEKLVDKVHHKKGS